MTTHGALSAKIFDLSVGGLGLRMTGTVACGEFVRVRVQLPTARGPMWFDPDAIVARVHRDTVGLSLVTPPPNLVQALAAHVSAHVHRPEVEAPSKPTPQTAARKTAPPPTQHVSRRELADLFRSALESVSEEDRKAKKKR